MLSAALQNNVAMIQKGAQNFADAHNPRRAVAVKHVHIHIKLRLKFGLLKQMLHQERGVNRAVFRL